MFFLVVVFKMIPKIPPPSEEEIKRVIAFTQTFTRDEWLDYVTKIHEEEKKTAKKRLEDIDKAYMKRIILIFVIMALILGVGLWLKK